MLLLTARLDNSERVLKPALERGAVVIADRYLDSWYAYQSIRLARYFGDADEALEFLVSLHSAFSERALLVMPDRTVWISDDPHRAVSRAGPGRQISKYENLPAQLLVDAQYEKLHGRFVDRIIKVDARGKMLEAVYAEVQNLADDLLQGL